MLALVAFEFLSAPRVKAIAPAPGSYLDRDSVTVRVTTARADHLHGLSVRLDGRDITSRVRLDGDTFSFESGTLDQGDHIVVMKARTSNLLRPSIHRTWRFGVDTVDPDVRSLSPQRGTVVTTRPVAVTGKSEPGAQVTVKADGTTADAVTAQTTAGADGTFSVGLVVPDGRQRLTVDTRDGAGNASQASTRFLVDAAPPVVRVSGAGEDRPRNEVRTAAPQLDVIAYDAAAPPLVKITIDGELVYQRRAKGEVRPRVDDLTEGTHALVVAVTDQGGRTTRKEVVFLTNSSEKLGDATLTAGARGRDVRDLQKLLKAQGYYRGTPTAVFDRRTGLALTRFQEHLGMEADGIAGERVLAALNGRILIDQSDHKLWFYLAGKLRKVYGVATGVPAFPTPNGTFYVVWMTKNPTWTPPDSPWAEGAEPIAPGPNNPVGMRWIGLNYTGVGIHGVPPSAEGSIGSYASHGCIRMHERDVEELFEMVAVGMPVIIRP